MNNKFKAIYQEYDWCYQKYIIEGLSHDEMAKEANCSKRVIKKWCCEKHRLTQEYRKMNQCLNDVQKELIIGSMLGDGHIDKREDCPIFIVSHANNQKDYLFWKYDILKNLCNKEPVERQGCAKKFNGDTYLCQKYFRIETRILDCLKNIRDMEVKDLLDNITEFGFAIALLDDGSRSNSNWTYCIAPYIEDDKQYMIKTFKDKFDLECHIKKDTRYLIFTAESSRKIDNMILKNIPNSLDIVKCKITDKKICNPNNYIIVDYNGEKMGLTKACKIYGISSSKNAKRYKAMKEIYLSQNIQNFELLLKMTNGEGDNNE